jgi:hypothetical protein
VAAIYEESIQSLFLTIQVRGQALSTATGFVVEDRGRPFLVTNWHVLAGRDAMTGELLSASGAEPDAIEIAHNGGAGWGSVATVTEPLYDPEDPDHEDAFDRVARWTGHPEGPAVDVAVLPLTMLDGVTLIPHRLPTGPRHDVVMEVTSELSVVGFPFGLTHAKKLGIWTRGTVATEYYVDYDGRPCFLIDARTRSGQSGSPVLYFNTDSRNVQFRGDVYAGDRGSYSQLLGIYSGRLNTSSDLGYVWRPRAITETIAAAHLRHP